MIKSLSGGSVSMLSSAFVWAPIIAAVLGVVLIPLTAIFASPSEVGQLSMAQQVAKFGVMGLGLSLHQFYVREFYDVQDRNQLLTVTLVPPLALWLAISLFSLWFFESVTEFLFNEQSLFLFFGAALVALSAVVANVMVHVARMQDAKRLFAYVSIAPKLLYVFFFGALLISGLFNHLISINIPIFSPVKIFIFSQVLFLFTMVSILAMSVLGKNVLVSKRLLSQAAKFCWPLVLVGLLLFLHQSIDRLFVRNLIGLEAVGFYSVSAVFSSLVYLLGSIVNNLWQPYVYKNLDKASYSQLVNAVSLKISIGSAIFIFLATPIIYFYIRLLPDEYEGIAPLVYVLMLPPIFHVFSEISGMGAGIARKNHYLLPVYMLTGVAAVALGYVLTTNLGLMGAALSSAIAMFLLFVLRTELSRVMTGGDRPKWMIIFSFVYLVCAIIIVLSES